MRKIYRGILTGCIALVATTSAHAVESEVNADISAKITSGYIRRGCVINEDPCFQPSVTLSSGNFALHVWGTWDITRTTNSSQRTRVDTTLDYTRVINKHILSGGLIAYIYHDSQYTDSKKDTFEVFAEYTMDIPLLPSVAINYDFGEIEGFYIEISAGHSVGLIKGIADMDFRAGIGIADENHSIEVFNEVENLPEKTGFVDATVSISIPIQLGDLMTLTPSMTYMTLVDSELREAVDNAGQDINHFIYGVTCTYMF
ncbi:MAG: hypothetical protein JXN60_07695 [Lentisphaerae bacterium]|nr:hypothetical protein [Lentisphaerota bacterium]